MHKRNIVVVIKDFALTWILIKASKLLKFTALVSWRNGSVDKSTVQLLALKFPSSSQVSEIIM